MSTPEAQPMPPQPPKSGGGKCLIGCAVLALVAFVVCGGVAWYVATNIQRWTIEGIAGVVRAPIVQGIEQSDLRDEDKKVIVAQVDRVIEEAKAGKVDGEKLGKILENLAHSPLVQVGVAYFIQEKYVKPSGLSEEEKQQAERTLDRVARGVFEKKISKGELDAATDSISEPGPSGDMKLKTHVTDEELRAFIAKCKKLADDAGIPDEDFKVDIGAEFKKAVDDVLGES